MARPGAAFVAAAFFVFWAALAAFAYQSADRWTEAYFVRHALPYPSERFRLLVGSAAAFFIASFGFAVFAAFRAYQAKGGSR